MTVAPLWGLLKGIPWRVPTVAQSLLGEVREWGPTEQTSGQGGNLRWGLGEDGDGSRAWWARGREDTGLTVAPSRGAAGCGSEGPSKSRSPGFVNIFTLSGSNTSLSLVANPAIKFIL